MIRFCFTLGILNLLFSCDSNYNILSYDLPMELREISGIEIWNDTIVAHNDSGNDPYLYFIDANYHIVKKVLLKAENKDWEDISVYEENIYLGDFGNNHGVREDLKLVRYNPKNEGVSTLNFAYNSQHTFDKDKRTPYDCESLFHINGEIFVLSKNKKNYRANLYKLNLQGDEPLMPIDSVTLPFLVTGAYYSNTYERLAVCGYDSTISRNFVGILKLNKGYIDVALDIEDIVPLEKYDSAQFEAILVKDNGDILLASENEGIGLPIMICIRNYFR
jgi:hypothetical protein